MIWLFNVFILAIAMPFIAGCATPTPYREAASAKDYGYYTNHIQGNIYGVWYNVNCHTDASTANAYWERRVLELCGCTSKDYHECKFAEYARKVYFAIFYGDCNQYEAYQPPGFLWSDPITGGFVLLPPIREKHHPYAYGHVECLKKSQ